MAGWVGWYLELDSLGCLNLGSGNQLEDRKLDLTTWEPAPGLGLPERKWCILSTLLAFPRPCADGVFQAHFE